MRSIILISAVFFLSALVMASPVSAQDGLTEHAAPHTNSRRIITQPLPDAQASLQNIHRVVAAKTPSGFDVPRYVSLKFGKINGRSGPSTRHPIVWQYRRAGLPVIIVAETENWRKIRDIRGDESWVYKAGLSGERSVIATKDTPVYKRASKGAAVLAIAEQQALLRLESCEESRCKVFSQDGQRGWVDQDALWGAKPLF